MAIRTYIVSNIIIADKSWCHGQLAQAIYVICAIWEGAIDNQCNIVYYYATRKSKLHYYENIAFKQILKRIVSLPQAQ